MKKPVVSSTNPRIVDETGGKHDLQLFYDTWMRYIELSKYLFGSKNPIYDINEIPENHQFYTMAKNIADQLGVDWKSMSHEDSNRIMLALLEDTYMAMAKVANRKDLVIELKLKIVKNEQRSKAKTTGVGRKV